MFSFSTIHGRLLALGFFVVIGLGVLASISLLEKRAVDRHFASITEANYALKHQLEADGLHDTIRGDVYALIMTRSESGGDRVREDLAKNVAALRTLLKTKTLTHSSTEMEAVSGEFVGILEGYATAAEEIEELLRSDRLAAVTRLADFLEIYQEAKIRGRTFSADLEQVVKGIRLREEQSLRFLSLLATGTSLLIALIIVLLTARILARLRQSLAGLDEHVKRVAAGDLSHADFEASDDELGQLRGRLENMTEAVRVSIEEVGAALGTVESATESIGDVATKVNDLTEEQLAGTAEASEAVCRVQSEFAGIDGASQDLRVAADQSASAVSELNGTCGKLSAQADTLEGSVDESLKSIRELSESAGSVASRTERLDRSTEDSLAAVSAAVRAGADVSGASEAARALADQMIQTAEAGTLRVRETLDGMQKILEADRSTEARVRQLRDRAQEIGQIADVIDGVASETKLLSLNASIISAQAGEEGRAFAVVASQVKELADLSRDNTDQIRKLVARVQSETSDAVETMEHSLRVVEREVARSHEAGDALDEIGRAAKENGARIAEISEAADLQRARCDDARRHMDGIHAEASEIRAATVQQEEAAKGLLERCQLMEEVGRDVSEASRKQALEAGHLAEMTERVRSASADIDAALSGQGVACSQAVELLDQIREKTRQSTGGLQSAVTGLLGDSNTLRRAFRKFRT